MDSLRSQPIDNAPDLSSGKDWQSDADRPDWVRLSLMTLLLLSLVSLVLGLPMINLLHPSPWQRSLGFWHSLLATGSTVVFVYLGTLAGSLFDATVSLARARWASAAATIASILTLLTGLLSLARYQAPVEDAAGVYIRVVTPLAQIGITWHLLTSLSLFGLSISSFYCLWLYDERIFLPDKPFAQIRWSVCLCFAWILLFGLSNFVVGISLSKIHAL